MLRLLFGKHVMMQLLWWRPLTFQCPVLHRKDGWSHRCNIKKTYIHVCNNIIIITWHLMLRRKEIPFHGHHSVDAVTLLCGLKVSKNNLWHKHISRKLTMVLIIMMIFSGLSILDHRETQTSPPSRPRPNLSTVSWVCIAGPRTRHLSLLIMPVQAF